MDSTDSYHSHLSEGSGLFVRDLQRLDDDDDNEVDDVHPPLDPMTQANHTALLDGDNVGNSLDSVDRGDGVGIGGVADNESDIDSDLNIESPEMGQKVRSNTSAWDSVNHVRRRTPMFFYSIMCLVLIVAIYVGVSVPAIVVLSVETATNNNSPSSSSSSQSPELMHIVLVIPDGFGPTPPVISREVASQLPKPEILVFSDTLVGTSRTRANDSWITDSAAGGTALATGHRTKNGRVSVDPVNSPIASLVEAAKAAGMGSGVVAKSSVTHATPAVFTSHVLDRGQETDIASQQINSTFGQFDVMLGGGMQWYTVEPEGVRTDGRNLTSEAVNKGYTVVSDLKQLKDATSKGADAIPILGLFAPNHMKLDIDHSYHFSPIHVKSTLQQQQDDDDAGVEPLLGEMAVSAISLLEEKYPSQKWFLMVECSEIDFCEHDNDPSAMIREVIGCSRAISNMTEVLDMDNTLIVVVADHGTGGPSIGVEVDGVSTKEFFPEVLSKPKMSAELMRSLMLSSNCTSLAIEAVWKAGTEGIDLPTNSRDAMESHCINKNSSELLYSISDTISDAARVGWTTTNHIGVDVDVFAMGHAKSIEKLRGNHANFEISRILADLLELDLDAATARLRSYLGTSISKEGRDKVDRSSEQDERLYERYASHRTI